MGKRKNRSSAETVGKVVEKEAKRSFDIKSLTGVLLILFIIWIALFGWTYANTNVEFYNSFMLPLYQYNIPNFLAVLLVSILVVTVIYKRRMKGKGG